MKIQKSFITAFLIFAASCGHSKKTEVSKTVQFNSHETYQNSSVRRDHYTRQRSEAVYFENEALKLIKDYCKLDYTPMPTAPAFGEREDNTVYMTIPCEVSKTVHHAKVSFEFMEGIIGGIKISYKVKRPVYEDENDNDPWFTEDKVELEYLLYRRGMKKNLEGQILPKKILSLTGFIPYPNGRYNSTEHFGVDNISIGISLESGIPVFEGDPVVLTSVHDRFFRNLDGTVSAKTNKSCIENRGEWKDCNYMVYKKNAPYQGALNKIPQSKGELTLIEGRFDEEVYVGEIHISSKNGKTPQVIKSALWTTDNIESWLSKIKKPDNHRLKSMCFVSLFEDSVNMYLRSLGSKGVSDILAVKSRSEYKDMGAIGDVNKFGVLNFNNYVQINKEKIVHNGSYVECTKKVRQEILKKQTRVTKRYRKNSFEKRLILHKKAVRINDDTVVLKLVIDGANI